MSLANFSLGVLAAVIGLTLVYALHALKPRRPKVPVGSAMLWESEEAGATGAVPWQRPVRTRLFVLQLTIVGIIALLLAEPSIRRTAELEEHTVVIVDVSSSMASIDGTPDRLSEAKEVAVQLLDELPDDGRVSLISAGSSPRVHLSASKDEENYLAAVQALRVVDGPDDVSGALTLASGLDRPDAPIGIVLISDGGHVDLRAEALPDGFTHRVVGRSEINHALTELSIERTDIGLLVTAQSEVFGGNGVETTIRFDVDGLTEAVLDVSIDPNEPTLTQVALPDGDQVVARLGGDDLLAADNTRYAIARAQTDLRVSVVGQTTPFVEALVNVVPGVTVVDPNVMTPDVTIFSGGIVPDDFDQPFLAIAPESGAPGLAITGAVGEPNIDFIQSADPLLTGLDLSSLRVAQAQTIDSPTGEVLIGSDAGPLVVRGSRAGTPYVYLGFALQDSSLPVEVAFPVLGQRILEELSGSVRVPANLDVGEQIVPPVGQPVVVTAPNLTELDRPAGATPIVTDRPGFWTLTSNGGSPQTIAVNVNRDESDLAPNQIAATPPRPAGPETFSDSPFAWPFVAALLVAGVLEVLEARRRNAVPSKQRRIANVLRTAAAVLAVISLVGWTVARSSNDVSTVFVLDQSDSVGPSGIAEGQQIVEAAIAAAPGGAQGGVVLIGDGAQIERVVGDAGDRSDDEVVEVDGGRTDLAAGLKLADALLPDDTRRRVVVVSDGRATSGDAEAAAADLGDRGIAVDYIVIESSVTTDAAVVAFTVDPSVDEDSPVGARVTIDSTSPGPATVTVRRNDDIVATLDVDLETGFNSVDFVDNPDGTGRLEYTATVDFPSDELSENDSARAVVEIEGDARVLVIEGTDEAGDALAEALAVSGMIVDVTSAEATPTIDVLVGYDSVVLADVSLLQLSDDQILSLVVSTRDIGVGLVTIGGTQSFGLGGYRNSELESVLPVISEITDPARQERVAQVLALDTSESMGACHCDEGQTEEEFLATEGLPTFSGPDKSAIARVGAAQAIDNLRTNDEVGILAVDTDARWIVDFGELPSQEVIDAGLATATPNGDSDFRNTLPVAARALRESDADLKHVIFFTDGFTSAGGLEQLEEQATGLFAEGITTSIVATGEGSFDELQRIAEAGGGRFYPGRDLTRIPDILVRESQLASGNFVEEGEFVPSVSDTTQITEALTESPALLGYVVATPKPTTRTSLRIGDDGDPLLASWQVGLGRSTVWMSDASPRWSQRWTSWDGYVGFWASVVRDTFPVDDDGSVRATVEDGAMTIRAEADPGQTRLDAVVSAPDGSQTTVPLREIAPGVFEGVTGVDGAGTYAVGVSGLGSEGSTALGSDVSLVSYAAEYRPGGPDEAALARLSEVSGGRGLIEAAQAFDDADLTAGSRRASLAPLFLGLAMALWLAAFAMSRLWFGNTLRRVNKAPVRFWRRTGTA